MPADQQPRGLTAPHLDPTMTTSQSMALATLVVLAPHFSEKTAYYLATVGLLLQLAHIVLS